MEHHFIIMISVLACAIICLAASLLSAWRVIKRQQAKIEELDHALLVLNRPLPVNPMQAISNNIPALNEAIKALKNP